MHGFTVAAVSAPVGEGRAITARAHARGVRAHEDLQFRRRGLAVSVVIILTLIAALAMKIDRSSGQPDRPVPGRSRGIVMPPEDPHGIHTGSTTGVHINRRRMVDWLLGTSLGAFLLSVLTRLDGTSCHPPRQNRAWPA